MRGTLRSRILISQECANSWSNTLGGNVGKGIAKCDLRTY